MELVEKEKKYLIEIGVNLDKFLNGSENEQDDEYEKLSDFICDCEIADESEKIMKTEKYKILCKLYEGPIE